MNRLRAEVHARRQGIEDRKRIDLAHEPAAVVDFVDVARGIDVYGVRPIELGERGQDVIAGVTSRSISGDRVNVPRSIHQTDALVIVVGDENVASPIDSNPLRIVQRGFISRAAIALIPAVAVSGERADDS